MGNYTTHMLLTIQEVWHLKAGTLQQIKSGVY